MSDLVSVLRYLRQPANFRLDGKVALVTGASGSLGATGALAFAAMGADVVVAARSEAACEAVAQEIRALGRRAIAMHVDVTDRQSVGAMSDRAVADMGRVDILFNCAGTTSAKALAEITEADWHNVMDVSVTGTFLCSQAIAPRMAKQGGGRIINMGSVLSTVGMASRLSYCAAKGAIANLTRALAAELAPDKITVNAIAPAVIKTNLNRDLIEKQPHLYQSILDRIPLHRFGHPEEIAGALVFLASPSASFITGQVLHIDGGYTAV